MTTPQPTAAHWNIEAEDGTPVVRVEFNSEAYSTPGRPWDASILLNYDECRSGSFTGSLVRLRTALQRRIEAIDSQLAQQAQGAVLPEVEDGP